MLSFLFAFLTLFLAGPSDPTSLPGGMSQPEYVSHFHVSDVAAAAPTVPAGILSEVVWCAIDRETGGVLALHDDYRLTLSLLDVETNLVQTTTAASGAALWFVFPQGPVVGGPLPSLTTTYKDVGGATHTITTPIVSDTEAGLDKARKLHKRLVQMMQQDFPPAPQ